MQSWKTKNYETPSKYKKKKNLLLIWAYQVMKNIGESPGNGRGQEGQTKQDQMHGGNKNHIGEPNSFAV